jgi:hypothetical protein
MSEVIEIVRVTFMAFVAFCAMQSVGPAYAHALRAEAAKSYSARKIGTEWVEIEQSMPGAVDGAKRQFDDQILVTKFMRYMAE